MHQTDLEATLKQGSTRQGQKAMNSTECNDSILFIRIFWPHFD